MPLAPLLCLIFFLSGASALVFESLWFFQAGLTLGNSIWASSLVLASFMAGLAVGNGWIGLIGDRIQRPIRLYALLEIVIGLTGVGIVFFLPGLAPVLASVLGPLLDQPFWLNTVRTTVSFGLMLIPATAMGATLPLLVSALYKRRPRFGEALGKLYGWNTLGAVCGVLLGELLFIELWGVRGTALVAAACNGLAALLSLWVARFTEADRASISDPVRRQSSPLTGPAYMILACAFSLGMLLLALEVVWFRFLILFVAGTSYAFAVMLAVVLLGIGLGGLLASLWLRLYGDGWRATPLLCVAAGVLCFWLYLGFELYFPQSSQRFALSLMEIGRLAVPLMFPVALISGMLFTFLGDELHRRLAGETRSAGLLTLANTMGAALGSLVSGFFLLPALGMERSLVLLALGYGVAAVLSGMAGLRPRARSSWLVLAGVTVTFLFTGLNFPHGTLEGRFLERALSKHVPPEEVVAVRESLTETIVYTRHDVFGETRFYRLITNSHSMSSTSLQAHRYMKLFVYLPVALHESPRKALLISYGVGATARALVDTQELEEIDIVDISGEILEMSRIIVSEGRESLEEIVTDSPLDDPRVEIHIEDGRFFLQTTSERFDLITGEPPPPKLAGIVNLYTREYFELIRERLADGGFTTYWLPAHSLQEDDSKAILRAFCEVFEDCTLWTGAGLEWIMMGSREKGEAVPSERATRQWADPLVGPEMIALGIERPEQLGPLFLADADQIEQLVGDTPALEDDFPKRLSSQVGSSDYSDWMDLGKTKQRFERSRLLDEILPASLRRPPADLFEAQRHINRVFGVGPPAGPGIDGRKLPLVHSLMEKSDLRTLPLWVLDGNHDVVRAARNAAMQESSDELVAYELAIWSLTRHEWEGAAELFSKAGKLGSPVKYLGFRSYSLCRAGHRETGRRLATQAQRMVGPRQAQNLIGLLNRVCMDPPIPN